jgi:hypothetical protein
MKRLSVIVAKTVSQEVLVLRIPLLTLLALAFVLSVRLAPAQETKTVIAEGVAAIRQDALAIARDQAVEDAQKRAVEQAIGIVIGSQTGVENYQVISDKILSRSKGYITRYTVIGENQDSGLLRVRITADVAMDRLSTDLSAIGIAPGRMGGTRTIAVTVTGMNKTQFAKFKDVLRNQVRGIKDLHERSFAGSTARISVDSMSSAGELSDELVLRDFGPFSVEVVGSTANSLELRVVPKK